MNHSKSTYGDLKVTYPNDCGNAPKKIILRDFTIALAVNDMHFISEKTADDFYWKIIGYQHVQGKENVLRELRDMKTSEVTELDIQNIITHGKTASLHGRLKLKDKKTYEFCHVFLSTGASKNAKLKEFTSYIIETSSE